MEEVSGEKSQGEPEEKKVVDSTDFIERAHSAADRLEKANLASMEILKRQETMLARALLGGTAEAGQKQRSQAEIDKEEALKAVRQFTGKR